MESRKNDGRDGGDAVDAWQGVQHLDMPDLDIPNLGEITSTFEPVTDVAPPHADASALVASPIPSVSDSPESVTRGGASSAGLSDSAESVTRGGAGGAGYVHLLLQAAFGAHQRFHCGLSDEGLR